MLFILPWSHLVLHIKHILPIPGQVSSSIASALSRASCYPFFPSLAFSCASLYLIQTPALHVSSCPISNISCQFLHKCCLLLGHPFSPMHHAIPFFPLSLSHVFPPALKFVSRYRQFVVLCLFAFLIRTPVLKFVLHSDTRSQIQLEFRAHIHTPALLLLSLSVHPFYMQYLFDSSVVSCLLHTSQITYKWFGQDHFLGSRSLPVFFFPSSTFSPLVLPRLG